MTIDSIFTRIQFSKEHVENFRRQRLTYHDDRFCRNVMPRNGNEFFAFKEAPKKREDNHVLRNAPSDTGIKLAWNGETNETRVYANVSNADQLSKIIIL